MKNIRLTALLLAIVAALSTSIGCTSQPQNSSDQQTTEDINDNTSADIESTSDTLEDTTEAEDTTEIEQPPQPEMNLSLTVEKIGSINNNATLTNSGFYYKENNKYGIISLDGKADTGAKYYHCSPIKGYFIVSSTNTADYSIPSSINCMGLVDDCGNVIIPEEYASIDVLNDRYAKVCEATEQTDSKNEALLYISSNMFASISGPSDKDLLYKGNWYIYDLTTGQKVEGATGTVAYKINTYGNYVEYITDDREEHLVNPQGIELPENAKKFTNGYYTLDNALYNSNDELLFNYAIDSYIPYTYNNGYIIAHMTYNSNTKYVIMDESGKIISAEFDSFPYVYGGKFIMIDNTVYDFSGNQIVEKKCEFLYCDDFGRVFATKTIDNITFYYMNGNVLNSIILDDNIEAYGLSLTVSKKDDNSECFYYSHKDKDFTLASRYYSHCDHGIVNVSKPNGYYDLVDTFTGETLLTGYTRYELTDYTEDGVYVSAKKATGEKDIYIIK